MATYTGRNLGEDTGRARFKTVRGLTSTPSHQRSLALFGSEEREVVVERFAIAETDERRTDFVARAKALATVASPHLPRVLELNAGVGEFSFVSAALAGDWLAELAADEARQKSHFLALAVELRVVLDVLAALSALHAYRGTGTALFHGAVAPCHVFVGVDGHACLTGTLRLPGGPVPGTAGYLAPEILLGDGTADGRADIYSACALLWQALSGKRLFDETSAEAIVARQLSGPLPRPDVRESWAEPLADVAARGLSVDPGQRYAAVNEIAMAIRMVAQARLAAPMRVGRAVESLAGDRLARRKSALTEFMAARETVTAASDPSPPSALTPSPPLPTAAAPEPPSSPLPESDEPPHSSGTHRVVRPAEEPLVAASVVVAQADVEVDVELELEDDEPDPVSATPPTPLAAATAAPTAVASPPATRIDPVLSPTWSAPIEVARAPVAPHFAPFSTDDDPDMGSVTGRRVKSPKETRATRLALLFVIATASLFGVVTWRALRRPPAVTATPPPPVEPSRRDHAPEEPATATAPPAAVPTASAAAATPHVEAARGDLTPPAPTGVVPASPGSAAATQSGSVPEANPTPAPERKTDKPRKTRSTYEPEGI